MLGLLLLLALGVWVVLYQKSVDEEGNELPSKIATRLDRLWAVAHEGLREKKYLRAEKALLTILRVDERNATAYNRLGILYAKQRAYEDAIECFEIAQSLEPSASSLHNVGLIYYETKNYEKAALAFEQALGMENDLAARHVAYAKVQEKLGHTRKMIEALERAVELEPNPQSLSILADAYARDGNEEMAEKLRKKAEKMIIPTEAPKKIRQPRKVVM
jgi:tetratricopeptide (TPR) repeat protein